MIVSPSRGIQGELFVPSPSDSEFVPVLVIQCLAEIPGLCGFVCRSVFPWSSVQVFVNYPIHSRAYIVFPSFTLSVSLLGVIDSVLSHHSHLTLSSIQCWWSNVHQNFEGSGVPFGNWLTKCAGYCKSSGPPRINMMICQFALLRKFRSVMVWSWVCGIGRDGRIVVWLWKLQHGWSFPQPKASRESYLSHPYPIPSSVHCCWSNV